MMATCRVQTSLLHSNIHWGEHELLRKFEEEFEERLLFASTEIIESAVPAEIADSAETSSCRTCLVSGPRVWSSRWRISVVICGWAALSALSFGEEPNFGKQIAPVIAKHCLECHSSGNPEGGLDLSNKRAAFKGGESGDAIVVGNAGESLLWQYIDDDSMPKERPSLSGTEKQAIKLWLE